MLVLVCCVWVRACVCCEILLCSVWLVPCLVCSGVVCVVSGLFAGCVCCVGFAWCVVWGLVVCVLVCVCVCICNYVFACLMPSPCGAREY